MKKIYGVFYITSLLFLTSKAYAQAPIEKGNVLINAGIGLGYYYAGGTPLIFSAEFAVNNEISVGPYLGYTSYGYSYGGYKWKYTFLDIGVRGSYHFSELLDISNEKIDIYGGAFLGYTSSKFKENSGFGSGYVDPYESRVRLGIHAGIRYYFATKVAGYAEAGAGITPLSLGVTFKL